MANSSFLLLVLWTCVLTAQSLFNLVKLPYIFQRRLSTTDKLITASNLLNVSPPWNAPSWVWKLAWNLHQAAIPILHLFDRCQSKESFVNLPVLWWKAISGNRKHSVGFDHGFAYDLLPGVARTIVAYPLCYLYPPLHHQNVLLRTVYLDQCILRALNETCVAMSQRNQDSLDLRVITLGAGFDTRCLRMLNKECASPSSSISFPPSFQPSLKEFPDGVEVTVCCDEYDLPSVVSQKRAMFERLKGRRNRRYWFPRSPSTEGNVKADTKVPLLHEVDLNDLAQLRHQLEGLLAPDAATQENAFRKQVFIIVVEAVLLYLEPLKATGCLDVLSAVFSAHTASRKGSDVGVYLCFADRLAYEDKVASAVDSIAEDSGIQEADRIKDYLRCFGFDLIDYLPKPGKARHMGLAKLVS